ncbi:class I SAM-dependent methyltransferase [Acuticoccus sp. MNP-M23]|uniref:class I SAM-dependent methyltransferase n=1 Tax=Acuticoccus sp. MNP-M23 TaxID=3072793 RepID=UPI0028159F3E|nr:class I SAM-dependent methyltransferase [Acuticoccus sp. MNP-M23]WMS43644.1 class I SAM-dependent methyltransferase [Acuticoccus sp. MNP-M23]
MTRPARFKPIDTASAQQMTAEQAIQYHYDNDTTFFSLWLDETLCYSSARWRDPLGLTPPQPDLASAQKAKIDHHLDAAALPPGGRLLDVGCGWGAVLAAQVARDPNATAIGLTLSQDQHDHIAAKGTAGVSVELRDVFAYDAGVPFQAVVSIGAFEHFARPQMTRAQKIDVYRIFFERIAAMTTPGARFSLQTIVWDNVDFDTSKALLPQTVFPQSDIPFIEEIVAASHGTFRLAYLENDPDEYAATLADWIKGLRAVKSHVIETWDEEKYTFFERYLRRSRFAFKQRYNSLARMVLVRR